MPGGATSAMVMAMDSSREVLLPFEDRTSAGVALGHRLLGVSWPAPAIVLALPRGGVPVAKAVARALALPLDVLIVRKVRHPDDPEVAIGAVAAGGVTVHNTSMGGIAPDRFEKLANIQRREVSKREIRYRWGRKALDLDGKTAILVDDGLATGATMRAALDAARVMGAACLVAAAPVGSREAVQMLHRHADEVVCLQTPDPFRSVGSCYRNFAQLKDIEVRDALAA
jgi:putative phosphoribosyl transferase